MGSGADLLHALVVALQHVRLYGADHAGAASLVDRIDALVNEELNVSPRLRIGIGAGTLTVRREAFRAEEREAGLIIGHLAARRVGGLVIRRDVSRAELFSLVRFLAIEPEELIAEGGLQEALLSTGGSHIDVEPLTAARSTPPPDPSGAYAASLAVVAGIYRDVTRAQPADVARARMTAEAVIRALDDTPAVLWRAAVARDHDELDPAHAVATAVFASTAARGLGLAGTDLVELTTAALLHDVGLFLLPEDVRVMERTRMGPRPGWRHMAEGAYLLRDLSSDQTLPMVVALEHHGGTPEIPGLLLSQSQLIGAADYLDALTADRDPDRADRSLGEVLQELTNDPGPQFTRAHIHALVETFHSMSAGGVDLSKVL
ncbi:MAG TPA: HD domain-containing protein [bacterium]|jgi:hypothetical protein|nr:HD domain-containing protein [bacterium]